jgi:hypothetical protein
MRLTNTGRLDVEGDVVAFSATVSDARLKDNIQVIDNAVDKIRKVRGVTFDWNNTSRKGERDYGIIAQEIESVFPELVRERNPIWAKDGTEYKTVDYDKLTAVLIEGVKEQQTQIEKQMVQIHNQQKQIDELRQMIETLMNK